MKFADSDCLDMLTNLGWLSVHDEGGCVRAASLGFNMSVIP
ncbi:hypothetical protein [Paucimonas lemoignei]|nr:hypothetical protein [Paucimonas lemoignei]